MIFSDFIQHIYNVIVNACTQCTHAHAVHTNSPRYYAWNGTGPNTAKIAIIADVRRRQIADAKAKLQFLLQPWSKLWFARTTMRVWTLHTHSSRTRYGIQSVISDENQFVFTTDNNNYFRFSIESVINHEFVFVDRCRSFCIRISYLLLLNVYNCLILTNRLE